MTKPKDLKFQILSLMRAPKYRPLDQDELARALGFKSENRSRREGSAA